MPGWVVGEGINVNVIKARCDRGRGSELAKKGFECLHSPRRVRVISEPWLLLS